MNKYQEAFNNYFTAKLKFDNELYKSMESLEELVDNQEKLKSIIKKYEVKLDNLKEYTQGRCLLNSLICDLNELIGASEDE